MKHINLTTVVASFLLFTGNTVLSQPQEAPLHPSIIGTGIFHGETPPLRDIPPMIAAEFNLMKAKAEKKALNKKLESCSYPFAATALPRVRIRHGRISWEDQWVKGSDRQFREAVSKVF